jgi:hypothetical protein
MPDETPTAPAAGDEAEAIYEKVMSKLKVREDRLVALEQEVLTTRAERLASLIETVAAPGAAEVAGEFLIGTGRIDLAAAGGAKVKIADEWVAASAENISKALPDILARGEGGPGSGSSAPDLSAAGRSSINWARVDSGDHAYIQAHLAQIDRERVRR